MKNIGTDDFRACFTAITLAAAKAGPGGNFAPTDARALGIEPSNPNAWGRAWRFFIQQDLCYPVAYEKSLTATRKRSNTLVYTLTERGMDFVALAISILG